MDRRTFLRGSAAAMVVPAVAGVPASIAPAAEQIALEPAGPLIVPPTYSVQWFRNGVPIDVIDSHTLQPGEEADYFSAIVTITPGEWG